MHTSESWLLWTAFWIAVAGTVSSAVFLILAFLGGVYHQRRPNDAGTYTPPLSILKPVHGAEESLEENIRSFFRQDYPEYELIFCARSLQDPAIVCAQQIAAEFPLIPARFIASGEPAWTNPKIFSMALMEKAAAHETVLFSDSDVRVGPDYLRKVIQPMADPNVGLVTCAFRGRALRGIWSQMTALSQTVEFSSGVFTANMLEGMKFGLGPTLLTTKENLRAIGGLESMQDLLADDFWLGFRTFERGKTVILSSYVADHHLHYASLRSSFRHQLGWMKNTRRSRPAGHLGTGLTYAMPFGLLGAFSSALLGHHVLAIAFLLTACINRWLQALSAAYFMKDLHALRLFWLHPLTDLMGFSAWLISYTGSVIDYRGEKYRLMPGGRIVRVAD